MSDDRKPLVFIDTETTGLDWDVHRVIELAYQHEDWDEPVTIFPYGYDPQSPYRSIFTDADPRAMEINRFYERYPEGVEFSGDAAIQQFIETVRGAILVGANTRFDARMIENTLGLKPEPWHHRLFELQSYAAGVLGLDHPIGWAEICQQMIPDLEQPDHSAAGDVRTVAEVYRRLRTYWTP